MATVKIKRVKLLPLSKAMPKWKELRVPVHPDGYVCTLPEGECHMPHRIIIGLYKFHHVKEMNAKT